MPIDLRPAYERSQPSPVYTMTNMTSYEIVRWAIEFERPERLPIWFDALGISDFQLVKWNQIGVGDKKLRLTMDEWGCGWMRSEVANMGQVKIHPLAEHSTFESFRWPNADDEAFYRRMEDRFNDSDGKFEPDWPPAYLPLADQFKKKAEISEKKLGKRLSRPLANAGKGIAERFSSY